MKVEIYTEKQKEVWDRFVEESKNGTFLFQRNFMEYHSHRFNDFSFLFYKNDKLIALLPGNLSESTFYSHQGLSYGGLIMNEYTTTLEVIEIFEYLVVSLRQQGIKEIIYKAIPHIYHTMPAEEDLYALFLQNAELVGRGIASSILLDNKVSYSLSRTRGMKKAHAEGFFVKETSDFEAFWEILSANLQKKYNTAPVHSLEEIKLLKNLFPQNIILYGVYNKANVLVGGEVVFSTKMVAHAQYTAATLEAKEMGAIDLVIDHIINEASADKKYFDYGISTENNGLYLNEGLVYHKEGFGARAIAYDIYSINLSKA